MLPVKFDSIWPCSFRGEDVSNISQSETRIALASIFVGGPERNGETLLRTLHRCLLPSLVPFGQVVSEEKIKI